MAFTLEVIPKKFYFMSIPRRHLAMNFANDAFYFTVDDQLHCPNINHSSYFGPPSIIDIYKYCTKINNLLQIKKIDDKNYMNKPIVQWSSYDIPDRYTNTIFLLGSYLLTSLKLPPNQIMNCIKNEISKISIPLPSYRDITDDPSQSTLNMIYFFQVLHKAISLGWFSLLPNINIRFHEELNQISDGNINWIIPGKIIAFRQPNSLEDLSFYIDVFKRNNVKTIIRLNGRTYDKDIFINAGFKFYDLYFKDGSCPSRQIIRRFMIICENASGAVAIHCFAGLGRTGTLIAAYLLRQYTNLNAFEAVAWVRLCRPGSILGLQQDFLVYYENWIKYGYL